MSISWSFRQTPETAPFKLLWKFCLNIGQFVKKSLKMISLKPPSVLYSETVFATFSHTLWEPPPEREYESLFVMFCKKFECREVKPWRERLYRVEYKEISELLNSSQSHGVLRWSIPCLILARITETRIPVPGFCCYNVPYTKNPDNWGYFVKILEYLAIQICKIAIFSEILVSAPCIMSGRVPTARTSVCSLFLITSEDRGILSYSVWIFTAGTIVVILMRENPNLFGHLDRKSVV